jgi:hypothetical protein
VEEEGGGGGGGGGGRRREEGGGWRRREGGEEEEEEGGGGRSVNLQHQNLAETPNQLHQGQSEHAKPIRESVDLEMKTADKPQKPK